MISTTHYHIALRNALQFTVILIFFLISSACTPQDPVNQGKPVTQSKIASPSESDSAYRYVDIQTSLGHIIVQLDANNAPKTVENFMQYVQDHYYDGTVFHRVIKDFMIQGGGFTSDLNKKSTLAPIENEADNGLKNTRGTIAMARTQDPHSATSQFFINHADNAFLDHTAKTMRGWGYAVFGKVVSGMDVVDQISNVKTGPKGRFNRDVPMDTVVIEKISETATAP